MATPRPGTPRRYWPRSARACPRRLLPNVPDTSQHRPTVALGLTPAGALRLDGSELAAFAITQAAGQPAPRRDALVVCVWRPVDVRFTPTDNGHFDADRATAVRHAAERTAAHGASLACDAGFLARSVAVEVSADLEGHRRDCRRIQRKPDRARTAPPQRAARTPAGQRRGRSGRPYRHSNTHHPPSGPAASSLKFDGWQRQQRGRGDDTGSREPKAGKVFPDLAGSSRGRWCRSFSQYAASEYRGGILDWGARRPTPSFRDRRRCWWCL